MNEAESAGIHKIDVVLREGELVGVGIGGHLQEVGMQVLDDVIVHVDLVPVVEGKAGRPKVPHFIVRYDGIGYCAIDGPGLNVCNSAGNLNILVGIYIPTYNIIIHKIRKNKKV